MKTYRLRPVIVDAGKDERLAGPVTDVRGKLAAKAANDNRRPPKALLKLLAGRALQILPPVIAAGLIIYVMTN